MQYRLTPVAAALALAFIAPLTWSLPAGAQTATMQTDAARPDQALPKAKVDQYDSVDLMYQAVNSGRADTAATDQSSVKYLMVQNPGPRHRNR